MIVGVHVELLVSKPVYVSQSSCVQ